MVRLYQTRKLYDILFGLFSFLPSLFISLLIIIVGKLVILDFGLMTQITDDQKYGMIEAIAHLIHRDYSEIGNDFVNLDFIPRGVDTAPIVPALARVFEAALAGGGAKSINFQELAADLAEITFKFPFRIPPYFALVIRAISVLEGIALVGNPEFAIIDEAYPYISKRLMTDESPRLKAAFRYMVYGQSDTLDVDRIIDMLQALEKFVAVKDSGDGSAFKVDGMRAGVYVGKGGDSVGTKKVDLSDTPVFASAVSAPAKVDAPTDVTKEALKFLFSDDGYLLRDFILEETCNMVDALSRDAARELVIRVGIRGAAVPSIFRAIAPKLTEKDKKAVDSISKLLAFLIGDNPSGGSAGGLSASGFSGLISSARNPESRKKLAALLPVLREFAPNMRAFGLQIAGRLAEKTTARILRASADAIFGPTSPVVPSSTLSNLGTKTVVGPGATVGSYNFYSTPSNDNKM